MVLQQLEEEKLTLSYKSLGEMYNKIFQKYLDRPMLSNLGTVFTYHDIDRLSSAFASFLINELHMKKGERIALVMPNIIQLPIAIIGAIRAGIVVVNINPQYTSREIHFILLDAGVNTIVMVENFADRLSEIIDYTQIRHVILTKIGDMLPQPKRFLVDLVNRLFFKGKPKYNLPNFYPFRRALSRGKKEGLDSVSVTPSDLAFLQYTGGTTGKPKGALLTHRNLLSNIEQILAEFSEVLVPGQERILSALPLYHVFALTVNLLMVSRIGAHARLITDPRKIASLVREIASFKPTFITGVNTLFNALTHNRNFAGLDFSFIKYVVGGGCAVQKNVAERWNNITGTFILEGYGMTECSPLVCVCAHDTKSYTGNIGKPVLWTKVRIVDNAGHDIIEKDVPGELWISGPQVAGGYWNRDEDTRSSFQDGWFHSGDIGVWQDGGVIKLVDRKKDMILVSGFNVYPNEIEEVVSSHSKVVEAGAIGVKSVSSGEVVKVFVVRSDNSLTKEELQEYCYSKLAHYKVPKQIEFVSNLPKSNIGKILRTKLREIQAAEEEKRVHSTV